MMRSEKVGLLPHRHGARRLQPSRLQVGRDYSARGARSMKTAAQRGQITDIGPIIKKFSVANQKTSPKCGERLELGAYDASRLAGSAITERPPDSTILTFTQYSPAILSTFCEVSELRYVAEALT